MDSLSQIALGAAVSIAVFRKKQPLWHSVLFGAALGTLPDLDVLLPYDDPISEMTYHRTESHALFYLTLISPLLAWLWVIFVGKKQLFKRTVLAAWLTLVTHPLLDMGTVYGTQFLLPFSDKPLGTGSVFVIDPLYTLPLLFGVGMVLRGSSIRWNSVGLILSSMYLLLGLWFQQEVKTIALSQLPEYTSGPDGSRLLVTATPANTLLWRLVFISKTQYFEAYYSILEPEKTIEWRAYNSGYELLRQFEDNVYVSRLYWFTNGFMSLKLDDKQQLIVTDLRMGVEPYYAFQFAIPVKDEVSYAPQQVHPTLPPGIDMWLYKRVIGETQRDFPEYQALKEGENSE